MAYIAALIVALWVVYVIVKGSELRKGGKRK
jgi:hypothetical protein